MNFKLMTTMEKVQILCEDMHKTGKYIPNKIEYLGFKGIKSYEHLKLLILMGEVKIHRTINAPNLASTEVVMTKDFYTKLKLGYFLLFFIPLITLFLCYYVSWWFIPFIYFTKYGFTIGSRAMVSDLYKSAMNSELEFCFLYYCGSIGLSTPEGDIID